MATKEQEDLKAFVKEAFGEVRAEINADAQQFAKELNDKYGSILKAHEEGEITDFFQRENINGAGDEVPDSEKGLAACSVILHTLKARKDGATKGLKAAEHALANVKNLKGKAGNRARRALTNQVASLKSSFELLSDPNSMGGLVASDESRELLDLLRPQLMFMDLGARHVDMPSMSYKFPYLATGVASSWVGEVEKISTSKQSMEQISMQAFKLATIVPLSNDLVRANNGSAERWIRDDIQRHFTHKVDETFIRGAGGAGSPEGLIAAVRRLKPENVVASATTTSSTGQELAREFAKLPFAVERSNIPLTSSAYIMSLRTWYHLAFMMDADSRGFIFPELQAGSFLGHRAKRSTAMPDTLNGNESEVLFGAFDNILVGDVGRSGVEVEYFPNGAVNIDGVVASGISQDFSAIRAISKHAISTTRKGCELALLDQVVLGV